MRYDTRARATSRAGGGVRDALVEALEPRRLLSAAVPAPFAVGSARLPDGFELTPGGEVTVGHRIIFPGGSLESAAGGQSLIYDGDIGTFSASAEPSSFRPNATGAAVGHRVVFAGGATNVPQGDGTFITVADPGVTVYDADTETWSSAPPLSVARYNVTSVTVADRYVVFAGGDTGGGSPGVSDAVDVYDATTGTWAATTALRSARSIPLHGAASGNDAVFTDGISADVYDVQTGLWSTAPLSQRRRDPNVVSVGNDVLIVGGTYVGRNGRGYPSDAVDLFDATSGQWVASHAPAGVASTPSAVVGNKAIFADAQTTFLGRPGYHPLMHAAYVFDADAGKWSVAHPPAGSADPYAAAAAGGEVVFLPASSAPAEVFDPATGEWSSLRTGDVTVLPSLIAAGNRLLIVENYLDTGALAGSLPALTATDVAPASNPTPADGASVRGTYHPTLTWAAVPGATGYTVLFDDAWPVDVTGTSYTPATRLAYGPHTWSVAAHIAGGSLAGPVWSFSLPAPKFDAVLGQLSLPAVLTTASRGSTSVTITNSGTAAMAAPFEVEVVGENSPSLPQRDALLGEAIVPTPLGVGQLLTLNLKLYLRRAVPGRPYHLSVRIGEPHLPLTFVTLLQARRSFTVAIARLPSLTTPHGAKTAGGRVRGK